jgi:hypothetical protein
MLDFESYNRLVGLEDLRQRQAAWEGAGDGDLDPHAGACSEGPSQG